MKKLNKIKLNTVRLILPFVVGILSVQCLSFPDNSAQDAINKAMQLCEGWRFQKTEPSKETLPNLHNDFISTLTELKKEKSKLEEMVTTAKKYIGEMEERLALAKYESTDDRTVLALHYGTFHPSSRKQ